MVTSVTLGNFFTLSNGKTVLGGSGGSGLDTDGLLQSLTEAKRQPAVRNQDIIDLNDEKVTAFGEYRSLLNSFKASLDALRNPPGVGNAADNVFQFRVGSSAGAASNYVTVNAAAGAAIQSYEIRDISSIAKPARQSSGTFTVANADTDVVGIGGTEFQAGLFTFNGQNILIEDGDSLNRIAAKFNAVSAQTKVSATVVSISATTYRLSFVATGTGTSGNFDLTTANDPDGVLDNIGLTAAVDGTNALFKLNDIDIERQTNTVSDVISGVTFNILQTTPDALTPYTVSVKPDTAAVQSVINQFINNYNALKEFEAKQSKLNPEGGFDETALLANNQTFLSISGSINSLVNTKVGGITGNNPTTLVDIGLSFINVPGNDEVPDVNNALTVNDGALTSALDTNFDGVARLFGFFLTSNNSNLTIFSRTNALAVSNFTLNLDPDDGDFEATYNLGSGPVTVELDAVPLGGNVDGYTLKGKVGTALEGLELIYASEDAATITVTATQGVADRLFNLTDGALKTNTGTIALELDAIGDYNEQLEKDIALINEQVDTYQEQLISRFAALEQVISRVNSLLQSLDANADARLTASQ